VYFLLKDKKKTMDNKASVDYYLYL